jgi:superfamily II DNA or RNA helicase
VEAPAGSGKTIIAAAAANAVARPGWRIGWLANTVEQVEQAEAAVRLFTWSGVDFILGCAAASPDFSGCQLVIVDEAHHSAAETWLQAIARARGTLWGFSATPWSEDVTRNALVRQCFERFHVVPRAALLDSGHLAEGKVYMHDVDALGEFDAAIELETAAETQRRCARFRSIPRFEHERRAKWQITQQYIQKNEKRNDTIKGLCMARGLRTASLLLLVQSVEHGESLVADIPGAVLVHSKVGAKARREAICGFRAGDFRVLAATSLADEGLDVPRASVLVLASGGRAAGKLEQRAGRVLRPFPGKSSGIVHDFLDRGAQYAWAQARARMRVYERLGYAPEIVNSFSTVGGLSDMVS